MSSRWRTLLLSVAALVLVAPAVARADVWVFTDSRGNVHFADSQLHAGYKLRSERRPRVPSARRFDGIIARASASNGVAPALIKAVVHAESNFDRRAVSHKGARGLMQLMPKTARSLGVDDPFDPWQNIYGGTRYLGGLLRRYAGDVELALAAYNAGATAVARYEGIPPYRETQGYVRRVLELYRQYHADFR